MATTRTIGPLHLEDLEPHRFEDLIRQLIYDFRNWRRLEATGRAGSDAGFDARGVEITAQVDPAVDLSDDGDDAAISAAIEDRMWLVQCKREKSITPKKLIGYLDAIPEEGRTGLYGIIFAAACDFSKAAQDAFRRRR
jgi:Restriction endonuclease